MHENRKEKPWENRIDWEAFDRKCDLRKEAFSQRALEIDECIANLGLLLTQQEFSLDLIEKAKSFLEDYQSEIVLKSKRGK